MQRCIKIQIIQMKYCFWVYSQHLVTLIIHETQRSNGVKQGVTIRYVWKWCVCISWTYAWIYYIYLSLLKARSSVEVLQFLPRNNELDCRDIYGTQVRVVEFYKADKDRTTFSAAWDKTCTYRTKFQASLNGPDVTVGTVTVLLNFTLMKLRLIQMLSSVIIY